MKLANFNVAKVEIFNKYGKKVTVLDSLVSSTLNISDEYHSNLEVYDSLLDSDLLDFLNQDSGMFINEYKDCQLIVNATLRRNDSGKDIAFNIKIPSAQIRSGFELSTFMTDKRDIKNVPFKWSFKIKNIEKITYEFAE